MRHEPRTLLSTGRIIRLFSGCTLVFLLFANAGFARSRDSVEQPAYTEPAAVKPNPAHWRSEEPPPANAPRPFTKGDAVHIAVFQDSLHFVNGIYHIDDEGYVFLPIVGRLKIDTLPERILSQYLNSAYLQFLRYPTIQVQPLIRISLLGGFFKPGLYYINPSASLWDAVALAGGPAREDGIKKITWEREGKIVNNNLLPSIESGVSLKTMGIRSGDQFWVTHVPKRDGWEIFTTGVLPMLSVSFTAAATTATVFYLYQTSRGK